MRFLELAQKRYSVRKYTDRAVPREAIGRCIEAARLAPSACNSQPWRFVVVDDPGKKQALAEAALKGPSKFNHFAFDAPVWVCVVSARQKWVPKLAGMVKRKDYSLMDIGIAAEHFCLQATEEGLGTCMLGWFNERGLKKQLDIPKTKRVELIITLGYPFDAKVSEKNRKSTNEMSSYDQY